MNKKNILLLSIFLLSCVIVMGNSTVIQNYIYANYEQYAGNSFSAHKRYTSIINSNPPLYAYKGYLNVLFDSHQYNKIIELIPTLDKKFEKDPEAQLLFVVTLEKMNRITESEHRLIALSSQFKTNSEITLRTAQAYLRRKEPENALAVLDTYLNNSPRKPNNFAFYFLKSQIHVQLNQLPEALSNVTLCLDMHPRFNKGWLLSATLQEQQGEIKKALQGYSTFLELSDSNNSAVEQHLFSLMLKHKSDKQYISFHKSYFDQALSLYKKKGYSLALKALSYYLQLQPNDYEALVLKLHLLVHAQDYKQATTFFMSLIKKNENDQLWPKNLYLLHHEGIQKNNLVTLFHSLIKQCETNYWLPLYTADLYIKSHNYTQATPLLEKVVCLSNDPQLNAKIYHQLSVLSYETQNYPQMLAFLEKGFNINEQNTQINNSLAYYWATKGKDLEKAHFFFDKINTTQQNSPCCMDTKALILYKQQQYTQAQELFEQLEQHNNGTMLLHLAKTQYKLNNKEKARFTCNKVINCTINECEEKKLKKLQNLLAINE